jgi:hypothetical protein
MDSSSSLKSWLKSAMLISLYQIEMPEPHKSIEILNSHHWAGVTVVSFGAISKSF